MIWDVTGMMLIPGECGDDCPGRRGLDCCCDECDYLMCCLEEHDKNECLICKDKDCPRSQNCKNVQGEEGGLSV